MRLIRTLVIVLSVSSVCLCQSPREIAQSAFKSVVLLEMNDSNGQPLSLGSGFYVADGIIATNAHVLQGACSGTAKLVGGSSRLQILGTVAFDRHTDLALLKVNGPAPSLGLGPSTSPVVGDQVYVVGNPLGLEGTFSEGLISGVRELGSDSILQMTAPISPGSSGGPVMDSSGAVIGIAEATFSNGQNLNLAVPVSYLSRLMASVSSGTPVTPLGTQAKLHAKDGSIVDGMGNHAESGVVATDFAFLENGICVPNSGSVCHGYEFRLTNKLPAVISGVRVRIIYYDASRSVMDFEDSYYAGPLPPGLTKTIDGKASEEADRAEYYYEWHGEDGLERHLIPIEGTYESRWNAPRMSPKVELRIIGFDEGESR